MALQAVQQESIEEHVAALLVHIEARSEECRARIRGLQQRQAALSGAEGFGTHVDLRAQAAVLQSQVSRLQVAAALAEAFLVDIPLTGPYRSGTA